MSDDQNLNPSTMPDNKIRPAGGTEYSWCRAVPCGTGITVLALLLSKPPNFPHLQNALHNVQNSHPILRSKHRFDSATNTFSFITPPTSNLQIQTFDLQSTAHILQAQSQSNSIAPFHLILEHEINTNTWRNPDPSSDSDVMFASVYTLSESRRVLALRLHTSACDRAAAVALLKELMAEMSSIGGVAGGELKGNAEVSLGIEDLVPNGKANKPFWARGVDMLGYSLNSLRLSNLEFKFQDANPARRSEVVKLQMDPQDTQKLLAGCKSREIKLFAALAAAGLIAARAAKNLPDHQWEKYAVVTLLDCRSSLDPPLPANHLGFYHSAIMNTHDMNGGSTLWELAERCYTAFANAKNSNKHFTDMSDLNFLMVKALENPSLTPSSSMRTALISVFEDSVIEESSEVHQELGVEDYEGCASVHGVGPSIAIFDTIRDGGLNCACVYPSPLHSRKQMQELMDHMKNILIDGCSGVESEI